VFVMSNSTIIYILIGILCLFVLLLIAVFFLESKLKSAKSIKTKHSSGKNIWYSLYLFFSKFHLTYRYIARVRKRFEILELADNWTIGKNTMKFSFMSFIASVSVFMFLFLLGLDLYSFIVGVLIAFIVHNQILNIFVYRIENKLLLQFEKFLGDVRHHYHEHGMIDEAIFDSIEDSNYEMSLHANKIHEILISNDVEEEIEKYNEVAPNKFFKTFLALCQTVLRFDDKQIDNKSMFLTNLNYLKQEINVEILKRQKLSYLFKSLSIISIVPIFTLKPLTSWALSNLPELSKYYNGSYGFIEQFVIFAIIIISYQLINRLQSNVQETQLLSVFEDKVLKIKFISNIVDVFVNANYSKSLRYLELLKNTGSKTNIKAFYLKRITYMVVIFLISLFVCINVGNINRYNILNSVGENIETQETADKVAIEELKKIDKELLLKYKGENPSYEDIEKSVVEYQGISDKQLIAITVERIQRKIVSYNNQYFKWWQLILCFLLGFVGFNIPFWLLLFRKKVLQMGMEDEVIQFHSIILMLMYIERISVENILQWMEQFAVVFKSSISKCINNFEHGDIEALEQLKIDEPFLPFTRLVENLQAASDKISVEQAFDELIIERGYYQDKRKQDNEIMIANKALIGNLIAFAPLLATLVLHLLLPFMFESINQLFNYSEQLKNIL